MVGVCVYAFWRWVSGPNGSCFFSFFVFSCGRDMRMVMILVGGGGGVGPLFCKLLLFLQVFVGIFEEFEEVRCFCSGESSYSGIIFVLVVLAC